MKQVTVTAKLFAVLALISGSIWIGSYLTRLFLVYQLFEGPELILKGFINNENLAGILFSIMPAIVTHSISFAVMIVAIIFFFLFSKVNLRFNGWLFIIIVAIVVTLPFEIYLMLIDYKTITLLNSGSFDGNFIIELLRERIKVLSSFSLVEVFTYVSFFYFIVFQPLTKKSKQDEA